MNLQKVELRLVARVGIQGDPNEELDTTSIAVDLQGCLEVGLEGAPEGIAPEVEFVEVTAFPKEVHASHHFKRAQDQLNFLESMDKYVDYCEVMRALAKWCLDNANRAEASHA